jgi:hypothetical protein
MSQLNELLIKLRQSAGLPEHGPLEDSPDDTASGMTNHEATPSLPSSQFPVSTETDSLLETLFGWAGADAKRWDRVLRELKRNWQPRGWMPDSSRDLLVAWAAANFRLFTARAALQNLDGLRYLTRRQRIALRAREPDISFYSRLAFGLKSWAANGLQTDAEAFRILKRLCTKSGESQS